MALIPERLISLKNGKTVGLRTLRSFEVSELLKYKIQVASETDFLLTGPEGYDDRTLEREENFIHRMNEHARNLLLIADFNGTFIGQIEFHNYPEKRRKHRASIGLSVAKSFWGFGLGETMMQELINYSYTLSGLQFLELSVMSNNVLAIGLYKKLGFSEVARLPKAYICDGAERDEVLMRKDL